MIISVIIPVYNVAEYLPQCLDSVLNQDYKNLEIICVEDCSSDNSLDILKKYQKNYPNIKIIENEHNLGLGLSRNHGLGIATGDYIHFLDSDDWLKDNAYSRLIKHIQNLQETPDILFFNFSFYDNLQDKIYFNNLNKKVINFNKIMNPQKDIQAFKGWNRYAWQKLHKRSFLLQNNIFYNDYYCMEDVEQAALVYVNCKSLCYVNEDILYYRINRKNSLTTEVIKNVEYIIKSFDTNKELYKQLPLEIQRTMLGYDYYLVREQVLGAYFKGYFSTFKFIMFLLKYNKSEVHKYICHKKLPYDKTLYIKPAKVIIKKHFPTYFKYFINLKKKLLKSDIKSI